jgi:hypothetical protein
MSYRPISLNQPQPVEEYIDDLLEELDSIDSFEGLYNSLPVARRVRFAPASTLVTYGSGRRRDDPIDLTQD